MTGFQDLQDERTNPKGECSGNIQASEPQSGRYATFIK